MKPQTQDTLRHWRAKDQLVYVLDNSTFLHNELGQTLLYYLRAQLVEKLENQ